MSRSRLSLFVAFVLALAATGFAQNALTSTTTAMAFAPNPVVYPGSTTVTVTVTAASGTPAGSVSIFDGTTNLVTLTLNSKGVATAPLSTSGFPAGAYGLHAVYAGNSTFATSTSTTVTVTLQSPVTVALQAVPNPITEGQTAELDATLTATDGGGAPAGTVTFSVSGSAIGSATVSGGAAVLKASTSGIAPGTYPVTAKYNGDTLHAVGTSAAASVKVEAPGGTACGTGSEAALNGPYAFVLNGFDQTGTIPYQTAGSFTANGSGGITGGEQDFNFFTSTQQATVSNLSVYSVGSDGRGCLTLVTDANNTQTTHTYRFALAATSGATVGQIIEFDDASGSGFTASGKLHLQTSADFSLSALSPFYALGMFGWTEDSGAYNRTGLLGAFALNTSTGAITSLALDANQAGTTTFGLSGGTGTFSSVDTHGRAAVELTAGQFTLHYAVYVIGAEFYAVSTDTNATGPVVSGKMHSSADNFNSTNISGTYVVYGDGAESNYSFPVYAIGTNVVNGASYTITGYYDSDGTITPKTNTGSATTTANGRYAISNGTTITTVAYVYAQPSAAPGESVGYFVNSDGYASGGGLDSQKSQTYSDAVLAASYWHGDYDQTAPVNPVSSGEVALSSSGNITGTVDGSSSSGLSPAGSLSIGTFAFNSAGVSLNNSTSPTLVGVATGSSIYVINETGQNTPILQLTIK